MSWCSDAPEDEVISLYAGLLTNPDVPLSLHVYVYVYVCTHMYMYMYVRVSHSRWIMSLGKVVSKGEGSGEVQMILYCQTLLDTFK